MATRVYRRVVGRHYHLSPFLPPVHPLSLLYRLLVCAPPSLHLFPMALCSHSCFCLCLWCYSCTLMGQWNGEKDLLVNQTLAPDGSRLSALEPLVDSPSCLSPWGFSNVSSSSSSQSNRETSTSFAPEFANIRTCFFPCVYTSSTHFLRSSGVIDFSAWESSVHNIYRNSMKEDHMDAKSILL